MQIPTGVGYPCKQSGSLAIYIERYELGYGQGGLDVLVGYLISTALLQGAILEIGDWRWLRVVEGGCSLIFRSVIDFDIALNNWCVSLKTSFGQKAVFDSRTSGIVRKDRERLHPILTSVLWLRRTSSICVMVESC